MRCFFLDLLLPPVLLPGVKADSNGGDAGWRVAGVMRGRVGGSVEGTRLSRLESAICLGECDRASSPSLEDWLLLPLEEGLLLLLLLLPRLLMLLPRSFSHGKPVVDGGC